MMNISHITLIVGNLEKTSLMLKTLFQAKEIYSSNRIEYSLYPEKFFLIDDLWLAIMEDKNVKLPKSYNHIAFKIDAHEIPLFISKIESLDLSIEQDRSRIEGEGASLYFYDYDNHLFELHTGTLDERLKSYKFYDENNSPL